MSIPHEQSDDSVLVQKCSTFLGLGPTSSSHLPYLSCCPFFWQHFIGLKTDLLSHGEALELSLGHSALEIAGEWKKAARSRHKIANEKPTSSNCFILVICFFFI